MAKATSARHKALPISAPFNASMNAMEAAAQLYSLYVNDARRQKPPCKVVRNKNSCALSCLLPVAICVKKAAFIKACGYFPSIVSCWKLTSVGLIQEELARLSASSMRLPGSLPGAA